MKRNKQGRRVLLISSLKNYGLSLQFDIDEFGGVVDFQFDKLWFKFTVRYFDEF